MSDRPEERYWADYLRISLPAGALLLLLGLFWYWAAALIGGGQASAIPTEAPLPSPTVTMAPSPTPSATATVPVYDGQTSPTPSPTAVADAPTDAVTEPAEETAEPSGCDTDFEVGSTVATGAGDVRLRAEPSTEAEVVQTLADEGTRLRVLGPVEVTEGCWWPVRNDDTGDTGFVREDLLKPA